MAAKPLINNTSHAAEDMMRRPTNLGNPLSAFAQQATPSIMDKGPLLDNNSILSLLGGHPGIASLGNMPINSTPQAPMTVQGNVNSADISNIPGYSIFKDAQKRAADEDAALTKTAQGDWMIHHPVVSQLLSSLGGLALGGIAGAALHNPGLGAVYGGALGGHLAAQRNQNFANSIQTQHNANHLQMDEALKTWNSLLPNFMTAQQNSSRQQLGNYITDLTQQNEQSKNNVLTNLAQGNIKGALMAPRPTIPRLPGNLNLSEADLGRLTEALKGMGLGTSEIATAAKIAPDVANTQAQTGNVKSEMAARDQLNPYKVNETFANTQKAQAETSAIPAKLGLEQQNLGLRSKELGLAQSKESREAVAAVGAESDRKAAAIAARRQQLMETAVANGLVNLDDKHKPTTQLISSEEAKAKGPAYFNMWNQIAGEYNTLGGYKPQSRTATKPTGKSGFSY
jgi:hypothetical protein